MAMCVQLHMPSSTYAFIHDSVAMEMVADCSSEVPSEIVCFATPLPHSRECAWEREWEHQLNGSSYGSCIAAILRICNGGSKQLFKVVEGSAMNLSYTSCLPLVSLALKVFWGVFPLCPYVKLC